MAANPVVEFVEHQEWLEPVETGVQKAVAGFFESGGQAGRQLQDFLHGTWLGHPLHPAITDVPLGAWTATLVLDGMEAAGIDECGTGADVALKVGLAGAAAAAVTGLTDWHVIDGPARRVGMMHGLLNLSATALYTASLVARNRRNREAGRALAFAGFLVTAAAAYLGGNLVFGKQIGVNHTAGEPMPAKWKAVMNDADLQEAKPTRAELDGVKLLLVRRGEDIHCISEVCSHLGGPLSEGEYDGDTITCPWHGSKFCLRDGSVIHGPATHPQPSFQTRVHHGRIEVQGRNQD